MTASTSLDDCWPPMAAVLRRAMGKWNTVPRMRDRVVIVVATKRFYSEELLLYMQSRGLPGPRVTNALPEQSLHVPATPGRKVYACDVGFVRPDGSMDFDPTLYAQFRALVPELAWGGEWKSAGKDLNDLPHFEPKGFLWEMMQAGQEPPPISSAWSAPS